MRSFLIPAVLAMATASSVHGQYVPTASPVILTRAGNQFQVTWQGADQRFYQVEESTDLLDWMEIGPVFPGTGTRLGYTNTNTAARHFYRVRELAMRPGFDQVEFGRNDDRTYPDTVANPQDPAPVPIGFPVHLFGVTHTDCYVNNNGNVTFDAPLGEFTPYHLGHQKRIMIAPFWADVDTINPASGLTRFSDVPGLADGRSAFGVTWKGVGYFDTKINKNNSFQLLLIDRSDIQEGDFDIEFNYHRIQWETGDHWTSGGVDGLGGNTARVGWANGAGDFLEFKGSAQTLAFLDRRPGEVVPNLADGLIYQLWNSTVPGRIVIPVRNGIPENPAGYSFLVNAGPDQNQDYYGSNTFSLSATITPPETTDITYLWEQTEPELPLATISTPASLSTSVTIPEPGSYKFRLTGTKQGAFFTASSDEVVVTHPDILQVEAGTYQWPAVYLQYFPQGLPLSDAVAKCNGVNITDVEWLQIEGEPAQISDAHVIQPLVAPPGPGVYKFRLTARTGGAAQWVRASEATLEITE